MYSLTHSVSALSTDAAHWSRWLSIRPSCVLVTYRIAHFVCLSYQTHSDKSDLCNSLLMSWWSESVVLNNAKYNIWIPNTEDHWFRSINNKNIQMYGLILPFFVQTSSLRSTTTWIFPQEFWKQTKVIVYLSLSWYVLIQLFKTHLALHNWMIFLVKSMNHFHYIIHFDYMWILIKMFIISYIFSYLNFTVKIHVSFKI